MAPVKITNKHHSELLTLIRKHSGKPTQHTFLDGYLGNDHKRYAISMPLLRVLAKDWMRSHRELTTEIFSTLVTSLIRGESSTEKILAGILFDYATKDQRLAFEPRRISRWLNHLSGWAEVDTVCTNKVTVKEIPSRWQEWKKVLGELSKSSNINKRRASLVLLCAPLRSTQHDDMADVAFANINRLKKEKEVLITKAISWVLRSMIRYNRERLVGFLESNQTSLPAIAVRETRITLETGKKTARKSKAA